MVDLRQSPQYAQYIKSLGWQVERVGDINVFIRKLGVFGAFAKIQRVHLPINWETLFPILKKHSVWMTKLEPLGGMTPSRFSRDRWPMLATKTLRINLIPALTKIQDQFKKDCRYILRKAEDKTPPVSLNDYDQFYATWQRSAKRKNLWIPSFDNYRQLIKCFDKNVFCVTLNNQAGAVVLIHDKVAYYYYAGATGEGNRANLPYLVVWECIKEAKKRGCKVWDFEGIYDGRFPNKDWLGFTHFKKSFGGEEIEFPGSFTKWF